MLTLAAKRILRRLRPGSLRSPKAPPDQALDRESVGDTARPDLACRAPFTSLHVDQFGDARPCCQSSRVLGNVAEQSLGEIWTGESLAELREAMTRQDLSLGCEHCEWAGRHGREATYAVRFDHDRIPDPTDGPARLELAPSNACNLQCAMCNGDWSSSIRLHREQRPALPRLFGDRQLAEVAAMADGLDELHLFGGEPLLMPEGLRLLDIAAFSKTRSVITTNGSVLTPRVEALLDRPGIDLVVSVDGTTAETYEAIRCGASWSQLEANLDRFSEIAARHGNEVNLAHCLMTANWHEFADHLMWAHRRGLKVYVNDVLSPEAMSLHHLTPPELRSVVQAMRLRQREVDELGEPWRDTWEQALAGLEQTLADGAHGDRHAHLGPESTAPDDATAGATDSPLVAALGERCYGTQASATLVLDAQLVVRAASRIGDLESFGAADPTSLIGRASAELRTLLSPSSQLLARTVIRWDLDESREERRYEHGGGDLAERRTLTVDGDQEIHLRFDYWLPPSDEDELSAIRSLAEHGEVLEFELDGAGHLVTIGPEELAARLGFRTELGISCRQPTDILLPALAAIAPDLQADEIEPGLVATELRWPDGTALLALAHAAPAWTRVRVVRPANL